MHIRHGAGLPGFPLQPHCQVDVQHEGRQQDDANYPQQWAKILEPLCVGVQLLRPGEDLEVADHVSDHEHRQHAAGQRYENLVADAGSEERLDPGDHSATGGERVGPALALRGGGTRHAEVRWRRETATGDRWRGLTFILLAAAHPATGRGVSGRSAPAAPDSWWSGEW